MSINTIDQMLEGIKGRLGEAAANSSLSEKNFNQLSGDINQFIIDLSPFTRADNGAALGEIKSQLSSLRERFSMGAPSQDAPLENRVDEWPTGELSELNERLAKAESESDTDTAKQIAQEVHDLRIELSPFERHDSQAFLDNLKERAAKAQTASPDVDEESLVHDAEVQEVEDVETQESDDVPTWKKIGAGILILSLIAMPFLAPLGILMGDANNNSTQVNYMNGPRGGTRTDWNPSAQDATLSPAPAPIGTTPITQPMMGLSGSPHTHHTPIVGSEVALYNPASTTTKQPPSFGIDPILLAGMGQNLQTIDQVPTGSEVALYGQTTQPMCGLNDMGTDFELNGAQHEGASSPLLQGYELPTGDEPTVPYIDPALLSGGEVVPLGAKFADAPSHSGVLKLPSESEMGVPMITAESNSQTPQLDPSVIHTQPDTMSRIAKTTSNLFCKAKQMVCKRQTVEKVCKLKPERLPHSIALSNPVIDITEESRALNGTSNY